MSAIVWPLLIYWFVLFIACFTIMEFGQDQLYDEVTPHSGLKVAVGSLVLAALATWLRPSFETMFTSNIAWTILQGIVWFAVFTLIFQFHPQHAAAIGIVAMLLLPGIATMGVESLLRPRPVSATTRYLGPTKPIRKPLGGVAPTIKGAAPASK